MSSWGLSVDTSLNLLWVAICLSGLIALGRAELQRRGRSPQHGRVRRIAAFLTIALAVFPCVSVSDDEASLWLLEHSQSRGGMGVPPEDKEREKVEQSLARLFDSVGTYQIQGIWILAVALCSFMLTQRPTRARRAGFRVSLACRAPPASA